MIPQNNVYVFLFVLQDQVSKVYSGATSRENAVFKAHHQVNIVEGSSQSPHLTTTRRAFHLPQKKLKVENLMPVLDHHLLTVCHKMLGTPGAVSLALDIRILPIIC